MKAFFLYGARDLRLEETELPSLKPDEVLVRVGATGICGSDLHYYRHGQNGDFIPSRPFILGHECAGEIFDAGDHGHHLPVGTRVAIDPSDPCRNCHYCHNGRFNLCPNMRYYGSAAVTPPVDGSFRDFVPARADNCHIIPDDMSLETAALLEPLSVALEGVRQAGNVAGKRILITGAGPIGQLLGMVARHYGAETLVVSDLRPSALDLASQLWADITVLASDPGDMDKAAQKCNDFEIIIEASGAGLALRTAYERCRPGGTIVQLGVQTDEVSLPLNLVMLKELTVRGSFRFAQVFDKATHLLASHKLDVQPLISERVDLVDLTRGFESALSPNSIKVVVNQTDGQ